MARTKDGRRVVVEGIKPEIDGGRFPIKRTVGERVVVEADVFTDGHEAVSCALQYRKRGEKRWTEVRMTALVNDRWRAEFAIADLAPYEYTVQGWLDHFKHWSQDLVKRLEAGQDVSVDLLIGAEYVEDAASRAKGADLKSLQTYLAALRSGENSSLEAAFSAELADLMYRYVDRSMATTYDHVLGVDVDRVRARYSTWYEFFPRSCWTGDCEHGTFKTCEDRLPYVAEMGFDVLYFPPISPIGMTFRKGKNNNVIAVPGDVGSPWAIGHPDGGHKAILADLGTLEDFRHLLAKAADYGLEIALDIAFQASPDHPYVKEHVEWFKQRPDGTIQYAENPPKKYQDIYPFNFDSSDWEAMWDELKSVIDFWVEQGVKIFRIDNPHTKSFRFWQWVIAEVREKNPEVLFLAEAFTRPRVMEFLAKAGFSQSYNYFAWRNTRQELTEYFTELTRTDLREFLRPNIWPNTPDILTEFLQVGGRPAFMIRFVLAATLGASYGIYGPAYELSVNAPQIPGKEDYLESEKYEIKHWNVENLFSIRPLITRVNQIRRAHTPMQSNESLRFVGSSNPQIIAYFKAAPDMSDIILSVVNLDPFNTQSGTIELPLEEWGIDPYRPYGVHDLLTDNRYVWSGRQNYVELNPRVLPAHVFEVYRSI